jgi:hypothetical protein
MRLASVRWDREQYWASARSFQIGAPQKAQERDLSWFIELPALATRRTSREPAR